jgi:hypothetical protein
LDFVVCWASTTSRKGNNSTMELWTPWDRVFYYLFFFTYVVKLLYRHATACRTVYVHVINQRYCSREIIYQRALPR